MLLKIFTSLGKAHQQRLRAVQEWLQPQAGAQDTGGTEQQHNHALGFVTRGCHSTHGAVGRAPASALPLQRATRTKCVFSPLHPHVGCENKPIVREQAHLSYSFFGTHKFFFL